MISRLAVLSLLLRCALAQTPAKSDLLLQAEQLQSLVAAGDWAKAAGLSRSLRDAVVAARNSSLSAQAAELTDSVLTWLPADTATLVVAQLPFSIPRDDGAAEPAALPAAQGFVLGLLESAEQGKVLKSLEGHTVIWAALAARNFAERKPDSKGIVPLGLIAYEGCAIYQFSEPVPASLFPRPAEDSVMGFRVWTSMGEQSDAKDSDTFFLTLLDPRLMSVCNDRAFLQEIVSRRGLPQQPRALPPNLPEWKLVDRTAPVWGLSHYAANPMGAGVLEADDAVGIAVDFGKSPSVASARAISKSDPFKITDSPEFSGAARSRKVSEDVWELSISQDGEPGVFATLVLMGALGFAVLL